MSEEGAFGSSQRYTYIQLLGRGTYGAVVKCAVRGTSAPASGAGGDHEEEEEEQYVAIKAFHGAYKEKQGLKLALREARVLRVLDHPNVVKLLDAFKSPSGRPYLVLEYLPRCVATELDARPSGLSRRDVKLLGWQLTTVMRYLHANRVVHRDIKPANILLTHSGVLKLCDFGFARFTSCDDPRDGEALTSYVVTRWYRAPEVLLGQEYGPPADIWSFGCTMAEMATGVPLLPGTSTADQLWRIIRMFGPLPPEMARCLSTDPLLCQLAVPRPGMALRQRLAELGPRLLELLEACLRPDPRDRPTAEELLHMPFFFEVPNLAMGHPDLEELYEREAALAGIGPSLQMFAPSAAASVAAAGAATTARTVATAAGPLAGGVPIAPAGGVAGRPGKGGGAAAAGGGVAVKAVALSTVAARVAAAEVATSSAAGSGSNANVSGAASTMTVTAAVTVAAAGDGGTSATGRRYYNRTSCPDSGTGKGLAVAATAIEGPATHDSRRSGAGGSGGDVAVDVPYAPASAPMRPGAAATTGSGVLVKGERHTTGNVRRAESTLPPGAGNGGGIPGGGGGSTAERHTTGRDTRPAGIGGRVMRAFGAARVAMTAASRRASAAALPSPPPPLEDVRTSNQTIIGYPRMSGLRHSGTGDGPNGGMSGGVSGPVGDVNGTVGGGTGAGGGGSSAAIAGGSGTVAGGSTAVGGGSGTGGGSGRAAGGDFAAMSGPHSNSRTITRAPTTTITTTVTSGANSLETNAMAFFPQRLSHPSSLKGSSAPPVSSAAAAAAAAHGPPLKPHLQRQQPPPSLHSTLHPHQRPQPQPAPGCGDSLLGRLFPCFTGGASISGADDASSFADRGSGGTMPPSTHMLASASGLDDSEPYWCADAGPSGHPSQNSQYGQQHGLGKVPSGGRLVPAGAVGESRCANAQEGAWYGPSLPLPWAAVAVTADGNGWEGCPSSLGVCLHGER